MECNFFRSENSRVEFAMLNGCVVTLAIDGQEFFTPDSVASNLSTAAKIANEDYALYKGWSDTHILQDASIQFDCCDCSWYEACEFEGKK